MTSVSSHSHYTRSTGMLQQPEKTPPTGQVASEIDMHTIYHGWPRPDGTTAVVIESPPGHYKPLPHHIHHSPAGFNCGYNGNGPRDLALSLLTDVVLAAQERNLATPSVDRHAQSHDSLSSDTTPTNSAAPPDTGRHNSPKPLPYLNFAEQIVAQLPPDKSWTLSRHEITQWLADNRVMRISSDTRPDGRRNQ
jgi:hypothetical protein